MERKEKEVKHVLPPSHSRGLARVMPHLGQAAREMLQMYMKMPLAICRLDFKNQTSSIMENFKHIPK